jgi:hypothetical protein
MSDIARPDLVRSLDLHSPQAIGDFTRVLKTLDGNQPFLLFGGNDSFLDQFLRGKPTQSSGGVDEGEIAWRSVAKQLLERRWLASLFGYLLQHSVNDILSFDEFLGRALERRKERFGIIGVLRCQITG